MLWFKLYNKYSQFTWWSYLAHLPLRVIHFLFLQHTKLDSTFVSALTLPGIYFPWWIPSGPSVNTIACRDCQTFLSEVPYALNHTSILPLIWNHHIQKAETLSAIFTTLPPRPVIKLATYQPPKYLAGEWIHKYLPLCSWFCF